MKILVDGFDINKFRRQLLKEASYHEGFVVGDVLNKAYKLITELQKKIDEKDNKK